MTATTPDTHRTTTPLPAGYAIRPARLTDAEDAAALINACYQALIGQNDATAESLITEWQTPGFSLERGTRLVFSPVGEPVAFADFFDIADPPVRMGCWSCVLPAHDGQGIREHLLAWAEALARESVARVPQDARVTLITSCPSEDVAASRAFGAAGFSLVRHFYHMQIALDGPMPPVVWPEGITIRTLAPGEDARPVIAALEESFRDHWGHVERPFEQVMERWQHIINSDPGFDPSLWFIAMDGDRIAGLSLCFLRSDSDPEQGWVEKLAVLRPYRQRGLGQALLQHSFAELGRRGQRRAGLGVDASNLTGAVRLYEKAGMHVFHRFDAYEKELRPGVDITTQSLG